MVHLQRLAQLGTLTASVAHELEQPVAAILLHVETVRRLLASDPRADVEPILADIERDCRRATDLMAAIRDQARKRQRQFQAVDINALVLDGISLLSAEARNRKITLAPQLGSDMPPAKGVSAELLQVLLNLATNAIEAMTDTPAAERCMTLRTQRHGEHVQLSVLDNGHGITADDMRSLFEPFFTTRADGTGLGLFIARSIVEAHEGRIWGENLSSGGAAFHFTVPVSGDGP